MLGDRWETGVMQSCNTRENICLFKSGCHTIGKLIIWWDCCLNATADLVQSPPHRRIFHMVREATLCLPLWQCNTFCSLIFFFLVTSCVWRQTKCPWVTSAFHQSLIRQARCLTVLWVAKECAFERSHLRSLNIKHFCLSAALVHFCPLDFILSHSDALDFF